LWPGQAGRIETKLVADAADLACIEPLMRTE
jgi:hypothetical protein